MEIPKKEFVQKLGEFLRDNTAEYADVTRMDYYEDANDNEWLYVSLRSSSQKRININADSNRAIIDDFMQNFASADYLMPNQQIDFDEAEKES